MRALTCLLSAVGTVLVSATALASSAPFVKGPYLHDLGATEVEVRVEVEPPQPLVVEVAPPADAGAPLRFESKEARPFHSVRVTGLEPAHRYGYSVRAGKAMERGAFTTAPKNDAGASFTFLVYGDDRSDPVAHASVVRAMKAQSGDFLVNTGDFVEDGRDLHDWQSFFDVESEMLRDRCLFACVGNHELIDTAGENFLRYFGPVPKPAEPPRLYGTFRWGSARFFLLNGEDSFTEGPEIAWLERALASAESEDGLVWRFAVVHFGYRSAGPHGDNPRLLAARVDRLLKEKKIDLLVSGHDHIYERGEDKGMRYVVSGGGGAPLYRVRAPLPSTRKVEPTYHFVSFEVSPARVKLAAKRADGSVLDTCAFGKAPGWECDPKVDDKPASAAAPAPATTVPEVAPSRCGCAANGGASRSAAQLSALGALALLALRRRFRYARR